MKTRSGRTLAAGLVVAAALLAAAPAGAQTITVKLATMMPEGTSWHQILKEAAAEWKTNLQRPRQPRDLRRAAWQATTPTSCAR